MRIIVGGSTGLIGSALVAHLTSEGNEVVRLVRSKPEPGSLDVLWDPAAGTIEAARLEGLDVVVHLAGENIGQRWTPEVKTRIYESRVTTARLLSETLAGLERAPQAMVCASASGYYGDRGEQILTEESHPGSGFLADLCRNWEAATEPAAQRGIRVVNTRFGVVLAPKGGALERMIAPFRLGLGGKIGSGKQYMSWVAIDDLVAAVSFILSTDALRGPVNVTSPNPVTNEEFTRTLGRVLGRPAVLSVPAFALRLMYGGMADEALLASQRLCPAKLLAAGFVFRYPKLEAALRHVLGVES